MTQLCRKDVTSVLVFRECANYPAHAAEVSEDRLKENEMCPDFELSFDACCRSERDTVILL